MKIIKRTFSLFIFTVFLNNISFSQENTRSVAFKLYGNFLCKSQEITEIIDEDKIISYRKGFSFDKITPAINFGNENNHEIEITKMSFSKRFQKLKTDSLLAAGNKSLSISIGLKYEYDYKFLKKRNWRFQPYIGFSLHHYFEHLKHSPLVSNGYITAHQKIGMVYSVIPGFNIKITKKLSLNLNVPIDIGNVNFNFNRTENPTLSGDSQRSHSFSHDFFPSYIFGNSSYKSFIFRIGIAYKLTKVIKEKKI